MRLGVFVRQLIERELRENLKNSEAFFIFGYSKIKASDFDMLRENLKRIDSKFFVTRNILLKRILSENNSTKELIDSILQNTAVIFIKDPLVTAKLLSEFIKDHKGIEFKGGLLGERILDLGDFKDLSNLSSLEFLKAKLLFQMKSPLSSFTSTLKRVLSRFVLVLKAIRKE